MFWQSVVGGFTVLGNTKVLIGLGAYASVAALMLLYIAWREPKPTAYNLEELRIREIKFGEPPYRAPTFSQSIMRTTIDSIALGFMIAWLLPILLGSSSGTISSGLLFKRSSDILAYSTIAAAVFVGMEYLLPFFIPVVYRILFVFPVLGVFLPGLIILHYSVFSSFHDYRVSVSDLSPGILATIAYLIITGVVVRGVGHLLLLLFAVSKDRGGTPVDLHLAPKLIVPLLVDLGGIISLFMYAHYMGLVLRKRYVSAVLWMMQPVKN